MVMAQTQLGVGYADFLDRFVHGISAKHYLVGIGKAPVFAAIIALVGCFQVLRTRGGADSVGRQTTRSVVQAIEHGYKEASRTIFEANVTHAIAGTIMFALGSGPVKGFAVVLLIGIATSVFTAVVFTRMLVSFWLRAKRPTDINI